MPRPSTARRADDSGDEETMQERLNSEEGMGDALRGLINSSGIQSSVVKFGTRMKAIEVRLGKMQQQIDQLFAESATKAEQKELVDDWICTDKLIKSNEAMSELSSTVDTLATWATKEQRGRVDDILKWRKIIDNRQEKLRADVGQLRTTGENNHKETLTRFEDLRTFMDQKIHESVDKQPLIREIRERAQVLADDLVKLESSLKDWTSNEIRNFVCGELTTIQQRTRTDIGGLENAGGHAAGEETVTLLSGLGRVSPRRRGGGTGGHGSDAGASDAGDSPCASPRSMPLPMPAGFANPARCGSSATSTGSRPCSKQLERHNHVLSDLQVRVVNFVRDALVGGVRDEMVLAMDGMKQVLHHTRTELQALISKVDSVDRAGRDVKVKLKSGVEELHQELRQRPNFDFFNAWQGKLEDKFDSLRGHTFDTEQRVLFKLNEFVTHVEKMHDVVDSHEHCLRHHAEELANRSTKYQLLLLQTQVDACLGREDFDAEAKAIKKLITANTCKLDNLSMASRMRRGQGKSKKGVSRKKRAGSALSNASAMSSLSRIGSSMGDDDASSGMDSESRNEGNEGIIEEEPEHVDEPEAATCGLSSKNADSGASLPTTAGGLSATASTGSFPRASSDAADTMEKGPGGNKAEEVPRSAGTFSLGDLSVPEGDRELSGSEAGEEGEEQMDDEGSDEDSDWSRDEALPYVAFRQQLEGVSMGLFSLAYLVLRAPRRGGSLSVRLDREKELLAELENLRHWITHKMQPAGWDLSRLTTIALRCTHAPKEDANFPQVSSTVKQLMEIATTPRSVATTAALGSVNTKPFAATHKAPPVTPRSLPPIEGVRGAGL